MNQPTWIKADPDTAVSSHVPAALQPGNLPQAPPEAIAAAHHAVTIGSGPTAVLYGDLEDIHAVLRRAESQVLQLWTDDTHQPGEPVDASHTAAPDPAAVTAWKRWLRTPPAEDHAPDVPVTEFSRTDPDFWKHVEALLTAAQSSAADGDDVPRLMPAGAERIAVLPLSPGRAIIQVTMRDGLRVTTAVLFRRQLTPSGSGIDAAAEVLAVTAAQVAAAVGPYPRNSGR